MKLMMRTAVLVGLAMGLSQVSWAQVTYQSSSFESIARAWTDAGDEYAYEISAADEAGPDGTYTFSETGSAPGYSSSASVGVEHDSALRANGFQLTGSASGYVADDVGYAACSANSEAIASVAFTLTRTTRVTFTGALSLAGSSLPDNYSNLFELRRTDGRLLKSVTGTGAISYSARLTAGTYTVYVGSYVLREIDFSGGDVYENSTASFDVSMTAR
jgi:hypothetical protein